MKIEIICNPNSGHGNSMFFARQIMAEIIKNSSHDVSIFESHSIKDTEDRFKEIVKSKSTPDTFVFMGGDGTVSVCIDRMLKAGLNIPVALFPCGTVNDYSHELGINKNVKKFVKLILEDKKMTSDVAISNGIYTVNVASGGYFTHGSTTYSTKAKKFFGKIVYYIKGVFSAFGMSPQRLKFNVDGKEFEADTLIYLIANSKSIGGFKKMGAKAKINDGYYDLCAIKNGGLSLIFTFIKLLLGKHTKDRNVIYIKGKHFEVSLGENVFTDIITKKKKTRKTNPKFIATDIDGNIGPNLPLTVDVETEKLTVYTKRKSN